LLLPTQQLLLLGHHYGHHSLARLSAERVHQTKHLLIMPMCSLTWPEGARATRFSVPSVGTSPGRLLSSLRMQHTVPCSRRQQPASVSLQRTMPRHRRRQLAYSLCLRLAIPHHRRRRLAYSVCLQLAMPHHRCQRLTCLLCFQLAMSHVPSTIRRHGCDLHARHLHRHRRRWRVRYLRRRCCRPLERRPCSCC